MLVTVRFFASLREALGCESMRLEIAAASVAGVRDALAGTLTPTQREALTAPGVRVAVNESLAQGDAALEAGDEVAFLPPVTGG